LSYWKGRVRESLGGNGYEQSKLSLLSYCSRSLYVWLCRVVPKHGASRINIANVIPRDIKLFEQVFDLELRIQNPNDTPLEINGLAFELELNDKRFATGVSNQSLVIDRLSSDVIHVQAITTLVGFLRRSQNTNKPKTLA